MTLLLQAWAPAVAQTPERPERPPHQEQEIVITAGRSIGAAIGNPEPERQLNPADIAAYGASNLRDLVAALSIETRSSAGGGAAVVLLNGRRIFSFSEIADIPPEAVLRIDILPEEVARRYGHPVGAKVLNIVLRPYYATRVAELGYSQATAGGRASPDGSFTIARNGSGTRWNLNLTAAHSDALLEDERRVAGGLGGFRSLLPGLDRFTITGTVAKQRPAGISYAATARGEVRNSVDLTGPSTTPSGSARPLRRERNDLSARINASAHGLAAGWQWTMAAEAQVVSSETRGERAEAPAYRADMDWMEFSLDGLANRTIAQLPAGEAGLSLRAEFSQSRLSSRSSLSPAPEVEISRSRGTAYAALDLPLSSRQQGRRGVGNLTLGLGAQASFENRQRALFRLESSLNWSPVRPLNLGLSFEHEEEAPSLEDRGNPVVTLENAPIFDFTRGETAIVRLRTGGNPALRPASRATLRGRMAWQANPDLNLSATYTRTRTTNPVGAFPAVSPEVEQAFPDRFVRDPAGRLIEIDQSSVNFRRAAQDQLRWGLNWNRVIERQSGLDPAASPSAREAAAAIDRSWRLNLSVFHTLRLRDRLLVREGLPRLDFLDGSVAGIGGGRARNAIEAQASVGAGGLGARINGNFEGGSRIRTTSGDLLTFSPLARFDLRLFADLGQLMPRKRWTAGTRLSLQFSNVFDSRVRVRRGGAGAIPDGLQAAYLDPLGRSVKFSLRRVF